ncbi:MAG TPA: dipeptidase [Opitutaceae bacterium]|nr:dipeptidase [Opitutaceae bacterium]
MRLPRFVRALALSALLLPAAVRAETEAELMARATALHARIFSIDTHIDTPSLSLARPGWDISARHDRATDISQVDFPRMRDGGLKAGVFVVFVPQTPRTPEGYASSRDMALRNFLRVHGVVARYPQECELALSAADGPRIMASGKRAIYLSVENGYAIGKDLTLLKTYHDLGARFFGIAHNGHTDLADASMDPKPPEWGGVSPLGREAIAECNRLGLLLDGSHASDDATRQLIALSKTPVLLTHSSCKAINDHKRNVDDDLLRLLASSGGVIQMNTVSRFLVKTPANAELDALVAKLVTRAAARGIKDDKVAEITRETYRLRWQQTKPRATLADFLQHLFHAIDIAGAAHVGIGADMDGGGGVIGLEDVSDYPKITLALLRRGVSEDDVAKIWGGNVLRLLRAAEEFAKGAK